MRGLHNEPYFKEAGKRRNGRRYGKRPTNGRPAASVPNASHVGLYRAVYTSRIWGIGCICLQRTVQKRQKSIGIPAVLHVREHTWGINAKSEPVLAGNWIRWSKYGSEWGGAYTRAGDRKAFFCLKK